MQTALILWNSRLNKEKAYIFQNLRKIMSFEEDEVQIQWARGLRPVVSFPQQARTGSDSLSTAPCNTHAAVFDLHHTRTKCPACITDPILPSAKQQAGELWRESAATLAGCPIENQRKREKRSRKPCGHGHGSSDLMTQTCKPETQLASQLSPAPMASLETS